MDRERKHPRWRNPNVLWPVIIIFAVWILILVSIVVDDFGGIQEISLWEWVGVLIVPVALAASAALLSSSQTQRELGAAHLRAQDEALQQYLDQLSNLLVEYEVQEKPISTDLVRKLVQARTLALLLKLGRDRKRQPLKLIAQLELINRHDPLLNLKNAGLDDANLLPYDSQNPAQLNVLHLHNGSDPSHVDKGRKLLIPAGFTDRHLTLTNLDGANLERADLSGGFLYRTILRGADLAEADLRGADLRGADLTGANLRDADLEGARYDAETSWPERFAPESAGAVADRAPED